MKLSRIVPFVLSLLWAIAAMSAAPLAIKGIAIGEPVTVDRLRDSLGFIAKDGAVIDRGCAVSACGLGKTTIAGAPADLVLSMDTGARVATISAMFTSASFTDIDAALRAKYGKPTLSGQQISQTLFGARFQVITECWTDEAGNRMSLTNHSDATHGFLLLQSKAEVDRQAALSAKAKGDI